MKKILITGAAGFIGSHLAENLLNRGDTVVGIDNFDPYYPPEIKRRNIGRALSNPNYTLHEIDICNREAIAGIIAETRPNVVVHLAARVGVRASLLDPESYYRVNISGSQHILDACRATPPSHLVWASSSSVYGQSTRVPFREDDPVNQPISIYAATKRMNELMGHVYSNLYGMNITMLRFFTVYGLRQRPDMAIHKFARLIEEGRPLPMFGTGDTKRDYTYIDDIIDGLTRAVDRPFRFEIFNLGESRVTVLRDLIRMISDAMGKPAQIQQQPMQEGDVEITYADISKARELLGYAPRFDIEEGIHHFAKWYRDTLIDARTDT